MTMLRWTTFVIALGLAVNLGRASAYAPFFTAERNVEFVLGPIAWILACVVLAALARGTWDAIAIASGAGIALVHQTLQLMGNMSLLAGATLFAGCVLSAHLGREQLRGSMLPVRVAIALSVGLFATYLAHRHPLIAVAGSHEMVLVLDGVPGISAFAAGILGMLCVRGVDFFVAAKSETVVSTTTLPSTEPRKKPAEANAEAEQAVGLNI